VDVSPTIGFASTGVFTAGPNLFTGGSGPQLVTGQLAPGGTFSVVDFLLPNPNALGGAFIASELVGGTTLRGLFDTTGSTIFTGLEDYFVVSIFDIGGSVSNVTIQGATATVVPLPAGGLLLLTGLAGLGIARRRRANAA